MELILKSEEICKAVAEYLQKREKVHGKFSVEVTGRYVGDKAEIIAIVKQIEA